MIKVLFHILLLLGERKSVAFPRTSLYRGSLYQSSTVMHNMFEKTSETAGIDESTIKTSEINRANKSYPQIFVFRDLLWFARPCNFRGETRELRSGG